MIETIETDMSHIGMLRQWLNEDRIDDPKKMVSNDDICFWLGIPIGFKKLPDDELPSYEQG